MSAEERIYNQVTLEHIGSNPQGTRMDIIFESMRRFANIRAREAAEKAYDACLALIYQDPTADVEIAKQNYINTNYPL